MARPKRNSSALEKAKRRLESLKSIDSNLDLGGNLSVRNFVSILNDLESRLAIYNTRLSELDKMGDDIKMGEKAAKAMSESMLMAVASHYGKASQEYEMAGGHRRRSRGKSTPSSQATSPEPTAVANAAMNGAAAHLVEV